MGYIQCSVAAKKTVPKNSTTGTSIIYSAHTFSMQVSQFGQIFISSPKVGGVMPPQRSSWGGGGGGRPHAPCFLHLYTADHQPCTGAYESRNYWGGGGAELGF